MVGIDELTLALMPKEKYDFLEWLDKVEIMLATFLKVSKIEAVFGKMVHADTGIQ